MDRFELKDQILKSLELLNTKDQSAEFEKLCSELAYKKMAKEIWPSTGTPAGGDYGADFKANFMLTHESTQRDRKRKDLPFIGACSITEKNKVIGKIKSDVKQVYTKHKRVQTVYFFTNRPLSAREQGNIIKVIQDEYQIYLEIFDQTRLAELLADENVAYISIRFLHLPETFFGEIATLPKLEVLDLNSGGRLTPIEPNFLLSNSEERQPTQTYFRISTSASPVEVGTFWGLNRNAFVGICFAGEADTLISDLLEAERLLGQVQAMGKLSGRIWLKISVDTRAEKHVPEKLSKEDLFRSVLFDFEDQIEEKILGIVISLEGWTNRQGGNGESLSLFIERWQAYFVEFAFVDSDVAIVFHVPGIEDINDPVRWSEENLRNGDFEVLFAKRKDLDAPNSEFQETFDSLFEDFCGLPSLDSDGTEELGEDEKNLFLGISALLISIKRKKAKFSQEKISNLIYLQSGVKGKSFWRKYRNAKDPYALSEECSIIRLERALHRFWSGSGLDDQIDRVTIEKCYAEFLDGIAQFKPEWLREVIKVYATSSFEDAQLMALAQACRTEDSVQCDLLLEEFVGATALNVDYFNFRVHHYNGQHFLEELCLAIFRYGLWHKHEAIEPVFEKLDFSHNRYLVALSKLVKEVNQDGFKNQLAKYLSHQDEKATNFLLRSGLGPYVVKSGFNQMISRYHDVDFWWLMLNHPATENFVLEMLALPTDLRAILGLVTRSEVKELNSFHKGFINACRRN